VRVATYVRVSTAQQDAICGSEACWVPSGRLVGVGLPFLAACRLPLARAFTCRTVRRSLPGCGPQRFLSPRDQPRTPGSSHVDKMLVSGEEPLEASPSDGASTGDDPPGTQDHAAKGMSVGRPVQ
jgi:hypothetical protein